MRQTLRVLGIISATSLLTAGAARAGTVQVDLSPYANSSFDFTSTAADMPDGVTTAGNTGNPLASQTFVILPDKTVTGAASANIVEGFSPGLIADITVSIPNAANVYTLMNTFFGTTSVAATVEFKGTGGADQTFSLTGGTDIRDWNNANWTNTINGTTTQEWFASSNGNDRFDAQQFALSSAFLGQTLTDIIITAGADTGLVIDGNDIFGSLPWVQAINVQSASTTTPLPAALPMFAGGAGLIGLLARRRRQKRANSP
jgi:hypothetical protein